MINKLTSRIAAICPIHGIQATDEDPRLWTIDFKDEATEEQRDAALDLLANVDLKTLQIEIDAETTEDARLEKIVRIQSRIIDALLEYFDALELAGKTITPKLSVVLEKWRTM